MSTDPFLAGVEAAKAKMAAEDARWDADRSSRRVVLTPASSIKPRPVHWLWRDRIPVGELSLLAGREGIGKSTIGYQMAAWLTRGSMKGVYFGEPRRVIVAATEDSWEHTVVPRLMAAGADLDLVLRIDVIEGGFDQTLTLPDDLYDLEDRAIECAAVMLLLDPLMSRLSGSLDSHKDHEVRRALEPLVALGTRTGMAVVGLIHVNKGAGNDTLTSIMGSRAFVAVARSVLFAIKDPKDEENRILGLEKNNLGRSDLATLSYRIVGHQIGETDEGPIWTGKVEWGDESDLSVSEILADAGTEGQGGTAAMAEEWLRWYFHQHGAKSSSIVKAAAKADGYSERTIQRVFSRIGGKSDREGIFQGPYIWSLPTSPPSFPSIKRGELGEVDAPVSLPRQKLLLRHDDSPPGGSGDLRVIHNDGESEDF